MRKSIFSKRNDTQRKWLFLRANAIASKKNFWFARKRNETQRKNHTDRLNINTNHINPCFFNFVFVYSQDGIFPDDNIGKLSTFQAG